MTGATALTIAADAVTGAKIADDSIDSEHIVDGSIDTAHIGDDQVTAAKLANSINTDIATGVTANTTANNALPKAGGTMTGNLIVDTNLTVKGGVAKTSDTATAITQIGTNDGSDPLAIKLTARTGQGSNNYIAMDVAEGSANRDFIVGYTGTERFRIKANGSSVFANSVTTGTDTDTSNTGSVTLDFGANQNFVLTLTGNVTLANPSTEQVGQSGFITFIQDGTGSRTVSLGTDYETAGGSGLTLTSTASATDIVPYVVVASGRILLGTPQLAFA